MVRGIFKKHLVITAAVLGALLMVLHPAWAEAPWRHGMSLTGQPKYAADFKHTDYVRPDAPKGGKLRLGALGTFDNFNPFISGVKGSLASNLMIIYEPLLWASLDEPTTEYGLIAEALSYPDDFSSVRFRIRPNARWHDGKPVTADDVVYSFELWKTLSPQYNAYFQKVTGVAITGDREVTFTFSEKGDPSLPLYVGQMSVLPKHWWTGKDSQGRQRDPATTTLEPPLGSGPYRIKSFVPGRSISYERVADYWGAETPIRVGTENFNEIEIDYLRDPTVMFEQFRAGAIDMRRENSLKNWVNAYDAAPLAEGRIIKDTFAVERLGITRAFVFNQRRPKLQDIKVRKALALAYGFDGVNRQLFYNMLSRPQSYFPHTDFAADRSLSENERQLAARLPHALPPTALDPLPQTPAKGGERTDLREALKLLGEAGYTLKSGKLVDASGRQLSLEFVIEDITMGNVAVAYMKNLDKLGIATTLRQIDEIQYQNRIRTFDFDIVVHAWVQGHAPGNEQREYWGSASADKRGTNNMAGLKLPAVDALVEELVLAPDRNRKIAAGRLLDRYLRNTVVAVPISVEDKEYVALWNRFGRPATMPRYGGAAFPAIWWWDEEKARKTGGR
jgi:microcin C transport system substrate-binding protein